MLYALGDVKFLKYSCRFEDLKAEVPNLQVKKKKKLCSPWLGVGGAVKGKWLWHVIRQTHLKQPQRVLMLSSVAQEAVELFLMWHRMVRAWLREQRSWKVLVVEMMWGHWSHLYDQKAENGECWGCLKGTSAWMPETTCSLLPPCHILILTPWHQFRPSRTQERYWHRWE